ncbi:MAG: hypothetical protein WCZ86_00170 [Desulfurivibrionaceae bacterium]|jgi:hypothetical protein
MSHASDTKRIPSPDTQRMLESLKHAVADALEKKKRLGQYAVLWENNKPVLVGEDAPQKPTRRESEPV